MKSTSSASPSASPDHAAPEPVRALLFDAVAGNREVERLDQVLGLSPAQEQLLWIDLQDPDEAVLQTIARQYSLPEAAIAGYLGTQTNPALENCGRCFWLRVVAVADGPNDEYSGTVLTIIAGANMVLTLHRTPVEFLESFKEGKRCRGGMGTLGSGSFVAALLDWHLGTYFEAVSRFELAVERLEVDILSTNPRDCVPELRTLRKGASRLRRMLAPHRIVFTALPRPDFRPEEDEQTDRHFRALDAHYERTMDMVENASDLVVGSFELFSSQTALVANETMKILTFVTVVIGVLAVIGGILGMNFEAPFFKTGVLGFTVAVVLMLVLAAGSILLGRRRRWF
jgi:magnesium transporter